MDAFDGSEGSGTIAAEHLDEAPEWYERVPWDDDMKEVQVELPNFIARLLEHNNLPTSDDIRLCKEYQEKLQEPSLSVQNRIRLVVYQIDALQAELRNLEKEKTGYNKQSFACEVVCSPVRRLPLEIVQEIAIHLLLPRHHLLSGRDPIISTSQVCSGWRKAIASMPRLWARFGVDTTKITRSTYETAVKKAIVEYSDRSIPFPLDIEISLSDQELQSTRHERSHQLLSWLISDWSSIDRVRRLHIISFRFLEVLADEIRDPGTFSQLERLVLVSGRSTKPIRSNNVFDNSTNWGNLFLNAPNLRRISIDNKMGQFFQYLHFPFGQITHLFLLCSLSFGTWTSLLGQLSALESGFFCLSSERFTETTVHTPPLGHLAIMPESFEAYTNCIRLISKGRFPKLSHVEFMVPSSEALDPGDISLSSIPGVPLKHLSLFFMDSAPIEVLLAILRNSTDVTTLELGLPASQWAFLLKYLRSMITHRKPDASNNGYSCHSGIGANRHAVVERHFL
ncbi:hypothetical protein CPB84DRAFT_1850392 [Gymnopilus junonius]|uniref:F-box domain-containing protein n=1 Tax=Gymnopilus junonius TaxID=109634 RepID=A0A9P5NHE8_GYMJU|nr:hypothetical protein CPB84DRAFT_1850392 [Gymnopilus junonius]